MHKPDCGIQKTDVFLMYVDIVVTNIWIITTPQTFQTESKAPILARDNKVTQVWSFSVKIVLSHDISWK